MTAPVRGPSWLALAALALLVVPLTVVSPDARAAGTDIPENGALVLARGGTAVSLFGDAYALQFNPAGMASIDGLDVRVDARFVSQSVTFQRAGTEESDFDPVSNSAGLYTAPAVEVAYRLRHVLGGRLALGLGVWGPAGVGHYAYPDPAALAKDGAAASDIKTSAPQRYALIESNILILYPSVGASWKFSDQLAVGVTLQDARTTVDFRQSIAAVSFGGTEDPEFDAIVHLAASDAFEPTGILGVAWTPTPKLHIGASFRPQIVFKASGTMDIALPDAAKATGTTISGNQADLEFNLPPVARLGATWLATNRLSVSAEATYEAWSDNKQMLLTPVDVYEKQGSTSTKIAPIPIPKNWRDSFGGRVGASFTALEWASHAPMLEVHAGALYDSNAIPADYQSIDFITGDELGGSFGLTFHWKGFALTASGMMYAPVSIAVTDSKVTRAAASPEKPPVVVGDGTYSTSAWVAAVGLAYTGLGGSPASTTTPSNSGSW